MGEGTVFSLSVHTQGGSQVQVQVGGFPGPGRGKGVPGPGEGVPGPGGGVPSLRSRGGTQSQVQGGYPVSVKGKIFDTRFGLIHVQTGKKIFIEGPPLPPGKGKIF